MPQIDATPPSPTWRRVLSGFALALVIAFSAYLLMSMSKAGSAGVGSLWFLTLFPALLSALICYIGDPRQERSISFYFLVPIALVGLVIAGSVAILREGVICLIMLSPIWIAFGWAGAFTLRTARRRVHDRERIEQTFVLLPLLAGLVEAQVPMPHEQVLLTRSVLVRAAPAEIWPYAVENPSIGPREGRWTITQDIIGVPRPRATVMHGAGVGAVRTAYWGDHINFEEHITRWAPGRMLGWRFRFNNSSLQDYTDKHISPDGQFLKVDSGDYTIAPVAPGLTRLTLNTRYVAMTHVNLYARLWGEFLLGDTEDNILAIIKDRAEAAHARSLAG